MLARMWVIGCLAAAIGAVGCGSTGPSSDASPSAASESRSATTVSDLASSPTGEEVREGLAAEDTVDRDARRESASKFVRNFYDDLAAGQYDAAWARLGSSQRAALGAFGAWRSGYDTTVSTDASDVTAELTADDEAIVSATLRAVDVDACADTVRRRFKVTWTLVRQGDRWRGQDVSAKKIAGHDPATDAGDCAETDAPPDLDYDEPAPDPERYETDDYPVPELSADEEPCIDSCDGPGPVGNGYPTMCEDGSISNSGGRPGACSHHGGVAGRSSSGGGLPSDSTSAPSGSGTVQVDGYFRDDGTYVRPHTRRAPGR